MELKTQQINSEQYNNYKYIFIFGDSHCLCFGQGNTIIDNDYNIQMLNRDSASARGLMNKNSTLKYGTDIKILLILNKVFYKRLTIPMKKIIIIYLNLDRLMFKLIIIIKK